jgi:hypothetical protein
LRKKKNYKYLGKKNPVSKVAQSVGPEFKPRTKKKKKKAPKNINSKWISKPLNE